MKLTLSNTNLGVGEYLILGTRDDGFMRTLGSVYRTHAGDWIMTITDRNDLLFEDRFPRLKDARERAKYLWE